MAEVFEFLIPVSVILVLTSFATPKTLLFADSTNKTHINALSFYLLCFYAIFFLETIYETPEPSVGLRFMVFTLIISALMLGYKFLKPAKEAGFTHQQAEASKASFPNTAKTESLPKEKPLETIKSQEPAITMTTYSIDHDDYDDDDDFDGYDNDDFDDNDDDYDERPKAKYNEWYPDWKSRLKHFLGYNPKKDEELHYRELFGGDDECRFNLAMYASRIKNGPACIYAPPGDYYRPRYQTLVSTGAVLPGKEIIILDKITVLGMPELRTMAKSLNLPGQRTKAAFHELFANCSKEDLERVFPSDKYSQEDMFFFDREDLPTW